MYNFPDAPTTNMQITGPNGTGYKWDGTKWTVSPGSTAYLPLSGGTISGTPGSLGLGVTLPSDGGATNLFFAGNIYGTNAFNLMCGLYYAGGWKYLTGGIACSSVQLNQGGVQFLTAPSGTAGNAATVTQIMSLASNGILTLSGQLGSITIAPQAGNSPILVLNKSGSGLNNQIVGQTAGNNRWQINVGDTSSESGSNNGSAFTINRYSDAGALLDTPFSINRNSGIITTSFVIYMQTSTANHAGPQLINSNRNWWVFNSGQDGSFNVYDLTSNADRLAISSGGACSASSTWAVMSDMRLKQDVQPYIRGLDDILPLEPIMFRWNGKGGMTDDGELHYGLSAQQVEEYLPELVRDHEPSSPEIERVADAELLPLKSYSPTDLIFAMITAFKEVNARLTALEGR